MTTFSDYPTPRVPYGGEAVTHAGNYQRSPAEHETVTGNLITPSLNTGMATVSASPQTSPAQTAEDIIALLRKKTLANTYRHQLEQVLARLLRYEGDVIPLELASEAQRLLTSTYQLNQLGEVDVSVSKADLVAGAESFIDDATQAIRQWGKQINIKINQLWDGYFRNVKDIETRLAELDKQLQQLRNGMVVNPEVVIPAEYVKLLSVNDKNILNHKHVDKILKDEINYLLTLIKAWRAENISYKNRVMRYFGNGGELPLSLLNRPHPPLLSKMSFVDEEDMQFKNYIPTKSPVGHGNLFFHESTHSVTTVTEKASRLTQTHYSVILAKDTNFQRFTDSRQEPWSLKVISSVYDNALQVVEIMRSLAKDESALDVKDKEINEVISIIKQLPTTTLTDAFTDIITAYQLDVSLTQQNLFRYLYDFVTTLIDTLNLHLHAYRSA